ncbi:exosome complex component RRP4 [Candida albicans P57072]|mgnify:FL=1|uniref:Exosome complex exonuclease RRP4 n=1 Tax=Candida albicans (strain WO-1) TaxID=294748 RepID=C4YH94_CANAW|nr:exosome complex exonuclease RRP4 [Candida albicans WO-1]KGR08290.1 exosome complex component RRP4 [Candida albicans P57072]KGU09335.1 exosome complex component RRP4 [Candida albicans 19F]KGU09835.1 exosome complex component RRP4 [Candida albicans L26]KHC35232.1 exosome complex component RRP4 [Candida albicans P76055]KHC36003.1 exosome complex component RRP4 [Candida albicans P76067]KHC53338.1 exosome complex component RRP4 [Candida albicans P37039]KHC77640.1 exosome complex component RRP4
MDISEVISITRPSTFNNIDNINNDDNNLDIEMSDEQGHTQSASATATAAANSIVTPGELITEDPTWMKGHGTYFINDKTYSSVAGSISRVNRLLSVIPLRGRYSPETGDHVIGRITDVGNKRWKVDIGAKQDAILMLGSVNLPGGVLRRKSESDELQMRNFLKEGDLLNCEVQTIFNNGIASLHTRSLKYGKLRNGIFLKIPSPLIVKTKNHAFDLPGNVSIVLGTNGYIWLYKTPKINKSLENNTPGITRLEEESSWEIYSDKNEFIDVQTRNNIAKYYNIIKSLAEKEQKINNDVLVEAFDY